MLDTALAANATTLGAPEAAKIFRQQLNSSIKVAVNLLPGQKALLQKTVNYPLVFVGGKTVTNDHPVLVACRDIARHIYQTDFQIDFTSERTLVIGASAREIRMYNANPNIHYYVYGRENKDYDRIVRPALQDIVKMLKTKASKTNFTVFLPSPNHLDATKMRPVVKRYWRMQEIFQDYVTVHKLPDTIHLDLIEASTLVFEDSFYNFTPEMYVDVFKRTGARIAYGYGLLPMELLFPKMPENQLYTITTRGEKTTLVFRQGFGNGYVHDTEAWRTLLCNPLITDETSSITLAVEITARVGQIAIFKIYRCENNERLVRAIELTDRERFVKVLDIRACVNQKTGKVRDPLVYFSVFETEYLDIYNYTLSLDPKSVTFPNIFAYIRRRMGGMSLVTRELVEPWSLPRRHVQDLALVVLLEYKLRFEQREAVVKNIKIGSIAEKFLALIRRAGRSVFYPVALLLDWI